MKDKYKVIEYQKDTSLVCDNEDCNFEFEHVDRGSLKDFINHPCPECGENLLTTEDYRYHTVLMRVINIINLICFPWMFITGGKSSEEVATVTYHHHAGKTTIENER